MTGPRDLDTAGGPRLETRADMRRSAVDCFLKTGGCSAQDLQSLYGFCPEDVRLHGPACIVAARNWFRQQFPCRPAGPSAAA